MKKIIPVFLFILGAAAIGIFLTLPLPTNKIPTFQPQEVEEQEALLVFGGDMMFDRYIRQIMESVSGDYVFSCVDQALAEADAVIANLEGPITNNPSVSVGTDTEDPNNYVFTFPSGVAPLLARHNIFIVNIGNNHILNFGQEGLIETKQHLTKADVAYFGDEETLELEIADVPFSFINYNEFSNAVEHSDILKNVRMSKEEGNVPVVYAHWGDEYVVPPERVKILARQFVDAGAALVVGSHPHVVQEVERYKDTYIYYSLGNFIFDQYFEEGVTNGLLLSVIFTKEGVSSIQEIPIKLHADGRTCVADPVER